MNKLTHIKLSGYKSIRNMELEFGSLNVLIGANGAGKSNLLSFFKMLNYMMTGSLQYYISQRGGASAHLHYGAKRTTQLDCALYFETESGRNVYFTELIYAADDHLIFGNEKISFTRKGTEQAPLISIGVGHRETNLLSPELKGGVGRTAHVIRKLMSDWRVYHFHDTSDQANIKMPALLENNRFLLSDAGNIAAYLYSMKHNHPKHYRRIVDTIKLVAPFFEDFVLQPSEYQPDKIRLQWRDKEPDSLFGVNQLSDGTLRMISLITLLLQPKRPSLIIIDEPELGLHPYAINILVELLKDAATTSQIIVSTQSVTLVNALEPEDIIVVDRKHGQSEYKRLDEEKLQLWLEEYTLGELWEKNVLGGRPTYD